MEGAILPTLLQTTQPREDRCGCHRIVTEPEFEGIFRTENFL